MFLDVSSLQDCGMQLTDEPDKRCYPLGQILLCHGCHVGRINDGNSQGSGSPTSNHRELPSPEKADFMYENLYEELPPPPPYHTVAQSDYQNINHKPTQSAPVYNYGPNPNKGMLSSSSSSSSTQGSQLKYSNMNKSSPPVVEDKYQITDL